MSIFIANLLGLKNRNGSPLHRLLTKELVSAKGLTDRATDRFSHQSSEFVITVRLVPSTKTHADLTEMFDDLVKSRLVLDPTQNHVRMINSRRDERCSLYGSMTRLHSPCDRR
jgi:hypothetical protein